MMETIGFVWKTMASRRALGGISRAIVQQRLHPRDAQHEAGKRGFERVIFPARFDPDRADQRDRRTTRGEPLCERIMSAPQIEAAIDSLGVVHGPTQYDQVDVEPGGVLVKSEWIQYVSDLPTPIETILKNGEPDFRVDWFICGDLAFKAEAVHSQVSFVVLARFRGDVYVVDASLGHLDILGTIEALRGFCRRYHWISEILLENAANAPATEQLLRKEIPGIILEPMGGGTAGRFNATLGMFSSKHVFFLLGNPEIAGVVSQLCSYDGAVNADHVSSLTLGLLRWKREAWRGSEDEDEALDALGNALGM